MKKFLILAVVLFSCSVNAAGPIGSAIAPAQYVGYLSEKGDLGWKTKNYKNKFQVAMPFAAHAMCDYWQHGSRAAEYDDFKYIYKDLPAGKYFIMDPFKQHVGTSYTAKTGQVFTVTEPVADMFCKNYTSKLSNYKTFVIDTTTNNMQQISCDNTIRIACVKD